MLATRYDNEGGFITQQRGSMMLARLGTCLTGPARGVLHARSTTGGITGTTELP